MLVSYYPDNGLAEKPVPRGMSIAWLPVTNVTNVDFCFSISPPNFLLTDVNRIRASGVIGLLVLLHLVLLHLYTDVTIQTCTSVIKPANLSVLINNLVFVHLKLFFLPAICLIFDKMPCS